MENVLLSKRTHSSTTECHWIRQVLVNMGKSYPFREIELLSCKSALVGESSPYIHMVTGPKIAKAPVIVNGTLSLKM